MTYQENLLNRAEEMAKIGYKSALVVQEIGSLYYISDDKMKEVEKFLSRIKLNLGRPTPIKRYPRWRNYIHVKIHLAKEHMYWAKYFK